MRKVLLNKSNGKKSVNNTNIIPVELNRDVSLFHDEIMTDTVDTMQVYNDEKDKCNKHRFVFTLYPICTNVLFNNITEVVYKEGSTEAKMLTNTSANGVSNSGAISTQPLTRIQAIRNTEYSNDKFNLTYHCGADIFNNHLLRSKSNISVQKRGTSSKKACDVYSGDTETKSTLSDAFNTIGDYTRTSNGNDLYTYFPNSSNDYTYKNKRQGNLPLYSYDTIYSFTDAYKNGVFRKDGWIGFNNPTTFHISALSNGNEYYINKCINNREGCEFIMMAPEKDLFYFTPKKNPYKKRLEYNWDYCLTYPAESVYDDGAVLIGRGKGLPLSPFKQAGVIKPYLEQNAPSGLQLALFRSPVKHNLLKGDFVNIKFSNGQTIKCGVISVGDWDGKNKDRYFSIRLDDFIDDTTSTPERFTKVVNGFECEYYFRKFKKFEGEYRSTLNRLAFAGTVYGDEVSQIVYTDDIDISEYTDNLGRPLTEIYLTLIKSNRGFRKWYQENNCTHDSVEYSHVFGEVSSGLDMPPYAGKEIPTLRFQHNIPSTIVNKYDEDLEFPTASIKLESDITISGGKINNQLTEALFYGDLVEFNPITITETTLEIVKHRFNTAQREINNTGTYGTVYHDEVAGDNYDADRYGKTSVTGNTRIRQYEINKGYANLNPEGYVYIPHHKIIIGEYDTIVKQLSDTLIDCEDVIISEDAETVTFKTKINYSLLPYDIIGLMDKNEHILYQYRVVKYTQVEDKFECEVTFIDQNKPTKNNGEDFLVFKHNFEIPSFAYMLPDNTGRHIWRELLKPSQISFMSDLSKIPFTNNAFYHHLNITFPVRRQDPFNAYKLQPTKDGSLLENNFEIPSNEFDMTFDEYVPENDYKSCF